VSDIEEEFARQLKMAKIPFLREVKAIPGRKFRFDFQVKDLLIEVQGGIFQRGGHSTGVGISRDCEKGVLATLEGYHHWAVTSAMVKSGEALHWVMVYMGMK
jgi:hypothetical protein